MPKRHVNNGTKVNRMTVTTTATISMLSAW